jgi:hypothetical protein
MRVTHGCDSSHILGELPNCRSDRGRRDTTDGDESIRHFIPSLQAESGALPIRDTIDGDTLGDLFGGLHTPIVCADIEVFANTEDMSDYAQTRGGSSFRVMKLIWRYAVLSIS